jgi:TatD DNase family protein
LKTPREGTEVFASFLKKKRCLLFVPGCVAVLIDSHCHLDYFKEAEFADVVARAWAAGVAEMVSIGTSLEQSRRILALVEDVPGLWCSVGIHPQHAHEEPVPEPSVLAAMTDHPKVIGLGESGLDYFYETAPHDVQQAGFRAHIRAARLAGLPLAIHARSADDDIAAILAEERDAGGPFDFLLHCFSSGRALAEAAIAMGGYVSFSGILTFPKSTELREIARDMPADRILVETDAPYLAPAPHRGKRNEPAWVAHTAATLAEVRGLSPEALAALTTANFRRLYPKATAP